MEKHAYLIAAHSQFELLKKLIVLLDDERNDIYIHVDQKVKDFTPEEFEGLTEKSNIFFTKRTSVTWGGYSQINCELILLKSAVKRKYAYYHLISGVDLPLMTQNEIHTFFSEHPGVEIVGFENPEIKPSYLSRFQQYHFFQDKVGRTRSPLYYSEAVSLRLQEKLGVNRTRKFIRKYHVNTFQKGTNWFSITHDLAEYVLSKEKEIHDMFQNTFCCDEIFLQTIVANSPFKDKLFYKGFGSYLSTMRYVDWTRGSPYTFQLKDYDELMASKCFFARKFDLNVDRDIVEKIYLDIKTKQSAEQNNPYVDSIPNQPDIFAHVKTPYKQ